MKIKEKSTEQRFGHVNATNSNLKKKKNLFITNTHYTSNFRLIHVSDGLPEKQ